MELGIDDLSALLYQVDHIFLPPKLPQNDDYTVAQNRALIDHVLDALRRFKDDVEGHHLSDVQRAIRMVSTMLQCRPGRNLDVQQVCSALDNLTDEGKCRLNENYIFAHNTDLARCPIFPAHCAEFRPSCH